MPNIAYFCAMVLRTQCTGHCSGLYGKYGIPVRGGGVDAISKMWKKHQNLRHGATMMPLVSQSMGLQYGQTPK